MQNTYSFVETNLIGFYDAVFPIILFILDIYLV